MSFDAAASQCTTPQSAPDGLWDSSLASDIEAHVLERRDSVMLDVKAKTGTMNYHNHVNKLNKYYQQVKKQIMRYQNPTTGLFPNDLSKPNSDEAHVRDSLYCANALWALSQAYKRLDDDKGRTHELAQSAVKCMRGILECWLRQANKLEKFKQSQTTKNALHSKFNLSTGSSITKDDEFGHLQIDAVALFLIFMVQMLRSGLKIIFTADEVSFVQNLVFYVERAYRTPDFGMWERGTKYNNGATELHASSIGLSKAALESINGENVYGDQGASWTVIYVDIDAHNRNRTIFNTILPRESNSKNTDASLIPTVSWPAFAMHEEQLVHRTVDKALRKLKGRYGLKRYLRDGYGTVVEDKTAKYYKPAEVKNYDGIESEWPIFYAYLIIDSVYKKNEEKVRYYQNLLKPLLVQTADGPMMPKYYYVSKENIDKERENPGSQERLVHGEETGTAHLFLWGQSVYIVSQLLVDGLLSVKELDPTRRNLPAAERPRLSTRYSAFQNSPNDLVIQVLLIAESVRLQQMLATYGIQTQTPHQIEPIQIWSPNQLVKAYEQLGLNTKLGLTGRPPRPIGHLGTSKIYRACGNTFICYPLLFQLSEFYLSQDMEFVIDDVRTDLQFLSKSWKLAGRPTFCIIMREDNLRGPGARYIFDLLAEFKRGDCNGTKVRLGRLQEFISSACIEHLDFLDLEDEMESMFIPFEEKDLGKQFRSLTDIPKIAKVDQVERWHNSEEFVKKTSKELVDMYNTADDMYLQAQLLQALLNKEDLYYQIGSNTVEQALEKLSQQAGTRQAWAVVRFCSSLLGKIVDSLAPSITAILVRGKQVTLGVWGGEEEVIDKPVTPGDIKTILYTCCFPYDVSQAVLQQELIINIGTYISTNPELFHGMLKIRIGWIVQAMKLELKYSSNESESSIHRLSPSDIRKLLLRVVKRDDGLEQRYYSMHRTMLWNRQLDGALNRVPMDFYDRVWHILERTHAGIKVAGYHLPQQPTLSDMTLYELNFSLLVEQMLSRIIDPAYRQIIVETFMVVDGVLSRNPELSFQKPVDMDRLVQEAFEQYKVDRSKAGHNEDDMTSFYDTAPSQRNGTTLYIVRAILNNLLDAEFSGIRNFNCTMS